MPSPWQQLFQHRRVYRREVGDDLHRLVFVSRIALSKNRRAAVASRRGETNTFDELAELVDRSIHIPPAAGDLHVGLIHPPAVTHGMPGGLGQQGREPLHPTDRR
jgi:hypothetical protein